MAERIARGAGSYTEAVAWLAGQGERLGRLEVTGAPDDPGAAVLRAGRAAVAIVGDDAELPARFDALVVLGTSEWMAQALARIGSRRAQFLVVPCSHALLQRTIEGALEAAAAFAQSRLADQLLEIGMALNAERDPGRVLELILDHARNITAADAGSIYLVEGEGQRLRFKIAKNDSVDADFSDFTIPVTEASVVGTCVLTGQVVNIPDLYVEGGPVALGRRFKHDRSFDERFVYQTRSMITIPMRPPGGDVLGVIQLINAKSGHAPLMTDEDFETRVVPFSAEDERLGLSLAAQGAVALENARLYEEIQTLFEGFVKASVHAIEQRDPTTSGHSQRVADLTVGLAQSVDGVPDGSLGRVSFTREELRELEYAGLLHDFGKVGVREQVLVKAKKLYAPQLELVMARFDHMHTVLKLELLQAQLERMRLGREDDADLRASHEQRVTELDEMMDVVLQANEPTVLAADGPDRLQEVARTEFRSARNRAVRLLDDNEVTALLVRRGSLTEAERVEIQSHAEHTYSFLVRIPWGNTLSRVPEIAGKHHEYLDGSGYPHRIPATEITVQTRMMTICDIFDALTASDRPYKKAVPVDRALSILDSEAEREKIDPVLLDVFVQTRVFETIGLKLQ